MSSRAVHSLPAPLVDSPPCPEPARTSVLLVMDDESLAKTCARVMEEAGYSVLQVRHSGHALLACLQGYRCNILITELSMAEGSGPALSERLRRYQPDLQTLYFANLGTLYDAANVLVRPFTGRELLTRLDAFTSSPAS